MSETVGETLHVDPARINALRVYSSTSDFEKGVAKHVHTVFYDAYVVMEAPQPYSVRHDRNAVCLPDVIALPDGQLQEPAQDPRTQLFSTKFSTLRP